MEDTTHMNEFSSLVTQKINDSIRNLGDDNIMDSIVDNHQESIKAKIDRNIAIIEDKQKNSAILCCFNGLYPNKIGKPEGKNMDVDTFQSVDNILLMDHFQLPFGKGCYDFKTGGHISFTYVMNGSITFE